MFTANKIPFLAHYFLSHKNKHNYVISKKSTHHFLDQNSNPAVGGSSESMAKQLEDLEAVKAMLSPEEYTEKRAHILEKL
jgi:hypothetical protein